MIALAPAEVRKLVAIAARISSPHDGEALAAARILHRELEKSGVNLVDVLTVGLRLDEAEPFSSGHHAPLAPEPVRPTVWLRHQAEAQALLNLGAAFNHREREFLRSVNAQSYTTPAQRAWLDGLLARGRRAA
ncbi:hypothetical protein ACT009_11550 [Sphingomonas sp. Tas61C01]|uniref:hypothetical protein n=1 Tax=Sphingomonas sp. Tas61C01 TaxID=3458297 RepID=UPI00403EB955